jgi:RNA polymerase sigma factor (sigma-70 family)
MSAVAVEVFLSYAHADEPFRVVLEKHLAGLKRRGFIDGWHDRTILPGSEWAEQIDDHLNSASVILLLISKDFLASSYCNDIELRRAIERHEAGDARVVPVILKPVVWNGEPFARFQALPRDGKPVTLWRNRDEAFKNIVLGLQSVIQELRSSRAVAVPDEDKTTVSSYGVCPGAGSMVATRADHIDIELTINQAYSTFTPQQKNRLLAAIGMLLETDRSIKVIRERPGSVKLTLRLRPEEAERLRWAVEQGVLSEYGVVGSKVILPPTCREFLELAASGKPWPEDLMRVLQKDPAALVCDAIAGWVFDPASGLKDRLFGIASQALRMSGLDQDPDNVSTVVADAILDVIDTISRFESISTPIRGLLERATFWRAASFVRRKRNRPLPQRSGGLDDFPQTYSDADREADLEKLREYIGSLTTEQRNVIQLFYFNGLTTKEVAMSLGISVGAAKSRLHSAREQLRKWMASETD